MACRLREPESMPLGGRTRLLVRSETSHVRKSNTFTTARRLLVRSEKSPEKESTLLEGRRRLLVEKEVPLKTRSTLLGNEETTLRKQETTLRKKEATHGRTINSGANGVTPEVGTGTNERFKTPMTIKPIIRRREPGKQLRTLAESEEIPGKGISLATGGKNPTTRERCLVEKGPTPLRMTTTMTAHAQNGMEALGSYPRTIQLDRSRRL